MSEQNKTWTDAEQERLTEVGCPGNGMFEDCEGFTLALRKVAALEQSLAHERQELSNLRAEFAHERQQREAAEAVLASHIEPAYACPICHPDDALKSYTAKLLALAVEQRRALEAIASTPGVTAPRVGGDYARNTARAALATDLDALVAEAKELGIDTTTPAMAHEKGNAPR